MVDIEPVMQEAAMQAGQRAMQTQAVQGVIAGAIIFCVIVGCLVLWKCKDILFSLIEVTGKILGKVKP